jgi:aspartokinase/homoserine dehydrogenase 1
MKVLKFGGSSVADAQRIRQVANIIGDRFRGKDNMVVVVSALGGVTDLLQTMARQAAEGNQDYEEAFTTFRSRHQEVADALDADQEYIRQLDQNHEVLRNLLYGIFLVRECSPRTLDYVLSFGERNSAFLISHFLSAKGLSANYLDARKLVKTNANFGNARVDTSTTYENIRQYIQAHPGLHIVTGFIGSSTGGLTTTLGRGGSDYTASLFGAGLQAEAVEIWTDVNGVLTADPRKVEDAFTIPDLTYAEAMEMAHFGAKVIYPPTMLPAMEFDIPIYIKNTFQPDFAGTLISNERSTNDRSVQGISSIDQLSLLTLSGSGLFGVPGTAGRLFHALAAEKINVILITQGSSEHSISFAVKPEDTKSAKAAAESAFEKELSAGQVDPIRVEANLATVAIIGENMRYRPGIAGRMFDSLGKNGINAIAIAQGSSERNISVVIDRENESKALNALHERFFLSDHKELHVFMVGVGLIGSTLIRQIEQQAKFLREARKVEVRLVGVANSRKMLFSRKGIPLDSWQEQLAQEGEEMTMPSFLERMQAMNLSNSIFVDNTASAEVPGFYDQILESSISISTPNKIATSSSLDQYQRLKSVAKKRGVPFLYETNVGAGLPVLTTIQDLLNSGDRIIRIEGVLSGSLSYIFNAFGSKHSFSEVVLAAKAKGLTEPDPREDLSGQDVKRKLVILGREAGMALEPEDIQIKTLLPDSLPKDGPLDQFLEGLPKADDHFSYLQKEGEARDQRLRVIGSVADGAGKIELQFVSADSPFYGLSGSDNMIVFTTERYKERPLVVRGPGAGAEVTAAGVFAEVLRIGSFLAK